MEVLWDTGSNTLAAKINGTTVLNERSLFGTGAEYSDVRWVGFGRDQNMDGSSVVDDFEFGEVVAEPTVPSRLSNLAIRTNAASGAETLIMGVTIGGGTSSTTKPVLIRGVGPSLSAFGLTGFLANPQLTVFNGSTVVSNNDNWAGNAQVASESLRLGAFNLSSSTSLDAALFTTLNSGSYTVQITGVGGSSGLAVAEIYDATPTASSSATAPRLVNVSARARVGTGNDILIAGFTVGGTTSKTIVVRGIGPALSGFSNTGCARRSQTRDLSGRLEVVRERRLGWLRCVIQRVFDGRRIPVDCHE